MPCHILLHPKRRKSAAISTFRVVPRAVIRIAVAEGSIPPLNETVVRGDRPRRHGLPHFGHRPTRSPGRLGQGNTPTSVPSVNPRRCHTRASAVFGRPLEPQARGQRARLPALRSARTDSSAATYERTRTRWRVTVRGAAPAPSLRPAACRRSGSGSGRIAALAGMTASRPPP